MARATGAVDEPRLDEGPAGLREIMATPIRANKTKGVWLGANARIRLVAGESFESEVELGWAVPPMSIPSPAPRTKPASADCCSPFLHLQCLLVTLHGFVELLHAVVETAFVEVGHCQSLVRANGLIVTLDRLLILLQPL